MHDKDKNVIEQIIDQVNDLIENINHLGIGRFGSSRTRRSRQAIGATF